jgi:hypothetical protein
MRREGDGRKAGGPPGHPGSARELTPEDQVDEILEHYPQACGGCGREFSEDELRPGGRFAPRQVCELPSISVLVVEHRTHRLRCAELRDQNDGVIASPRSAGRRSGAACGRRSPR